MFAPFVESINYFAGQTVKNVLRFIHEPVLRIPETVGKGHGFIARFLSDSCAIFECLLLAKKSGVLPQARSRSCGGQRLGPRPMLLFMTLLMTLSWRFLIILGPERVRCNWWWTDRSRSLFSLFPSSYCCTFWN